MNDKARKEMFENKQKYVERMAYKNAEKGAEYGLTEEQSGVLDILCAMRHKIHSSEDLFFTESSGCGEQYDYLDNLSNTLEEVGLPPINLTVNLLDIPDDNYSMVGNYDCLDDALDAFYDMKEKLNNDIEKYLAIIDEKYHTQYCPTGIARSKL